MPSNFKIDKFEPKYLKKSHHILDKHLEAVEEHTQILDVYKERIFKETGIWRRIKHILGLKI